MGKIICYNKFKNNFCENNIISFIINHKAYSWLIFSILLGIMFGTISERTASDTVIEGLDSLFLNNFYIRLEQPFYYTFIISLTSSFIFIFILIMLGVCAFGSVFIPIIPFIRGFSMGLVSGYIYSTYGLKGILFYLIVVLPGALISAIAIILEAKESFDFSRLLFLKITSKSSSEKIESNFKIYLLRTGYIFVILAISSITDSLLSILISGHFKF